MGLFFMLVISLVSGAMITAFYEKFFRGIKLSVNDYHLHHSLYGIVLILVSVLLYSREVELAILLGTVAFGLGSILQHTYSEHLVFIEKEDWEINRIEGWKETSKTYFTKGIWITFYRNDKLLGAETNIASKQQEQATIT